MATRRVRGFTGHIDTLAAHLRGDARDAWLREKAAAAIDRASEINAASLGREIDGVTRIDGVPAPVARMRSGKVLSHAFAVQNAVVDWILERLAEAGPVRSGTYADSHRLLVNGEDQDPPVSVGLRDVVTLVNVQPYARRIERGLSDQAPDGVYEVVFVEARRRFGALANISFRYQQLAGEDGGYWHPSITVAPPRV